MTFLCNSKFISFLDDDNIVYPNHLETLFELFKNNDKLDWSYCLRNVWKNDWSEGIPDLGESIGFLYHTMISKDDHLVDTSCFLIKKDIAMKCIH